MDSQILEKLNSLYETPWEISYEENLVVSFYNPKENIKIIYNYTLGDTKDSSHPHRFILRDGQGKQFHDSSLEKLLEKYYSEIFKIGEL